MPEPAEAELGDYYDFLWHDTEGVAYLPTLDPNDPKSWVKNAFHWPADRAKVIRFTLRRSAEGLNVFASPALYKSLQGVGQRADFLGSWTLYMDFDGNAVEDWSELPVPEPEWKMQSSLPTHQHVYWQLDEFLTDAEQLEDRNRAMAYQFGADTSGWDANQVLRPVGTMNYPDPHGKKKRGPMQVHTVEHYEGIHSLDEFGAVTSAKQMVASTVLDGDIPDIETVIATKTWPAPMWELFTMSKEALLESRLDRSGSMQRLGYFGAEQGFSDAEIMAVLQSADLRWEKYLHRRDSARHLIDIINRARQKHGYLAPGELTFAGLIGDKPVHEGVEERDVYGFNEFVKSEFHVEWMLEGLLAHEGIGICTGFPGTGKTQFVIQAGASMGLGLEDFLGFSNVSGAKKVLFLSLEMSANPLHLFLSTIAPEYDDLETLNRNFKVAPLGMPLPLDVQAGQDYLNALLAEHQPDLLIIDSLQRIMSKELTDELSVKETMAFLASVRKRFGCAMLLVHHNRKKSAQDARKTPELSDMYGSTYIAADVDFVVNLARIEEGQVKFAMLKNRLGPEQQPFDMLRNEHLTYSINSFQMKTGDDHAPEGNLGF